LDHKKINNHIFSIKKMSKKFPDKISSLGMKLDGSKIRKGLKQNSLHKKERGCIEGKGAGLSFNHFRAKQVGGLRV
jgi:hypothetical protein